MISPRFRIGVLGIWAAVISCGFAEGEGQNPTRFHLLPGSDLSARVDGVYRPVVSADEDSFTVRMEQKLEKVPARRVEDVRVTRRIKLTNLSADFKNVAGELSSDAARDAQFRGMVDAVGSASAASVLQDRAYGDLNRAVTAAEFTRINTKGPPDNPKLGEQLADAAMAQAYRELQVSEAATNLQMRQSSDMLTKSVAATPNSGTGVTITPDVSANGVVRAAAGATTTSAPQVQVRATIPTRLVDAGNGVSDRLDVDFEVAAPAPLENAYAVLVTDFKVPGREGQEYRRVTAKRLGRVEEKAKRYRIEAPKFPPGFVVTRYDVLLYANGQEIATNLTNGAAVLSEDEAYRFLLTQYLEANKGKTRPPAAMLMSPKTILQRDVAGVAVQQPLWVEVDPTGKVTGVSGNNASDVEQSVRKALNHFRFMPALENGQQVGGRAKLVLASFTQ